MNTKKCSNKEHDDIDALFYCFKCQINLCDKCVEKHQEEYKEHQMSKLGDMSKEDFTELNQEEKNHK